MVAFKRRVAEVEATTASSEAQESQDIVTVNGGDMAEALRNLVPSLSLHEIAKYERLRDKYEA
jgi:hypothetical protein